MRSLQLFPLECGAGLSHGNLFLFSIELHTHYSEPCQECKETGVSGEKPGEEITAKEVLRTRERHKAFFSVGEDSENLRVAPNQVLL